VEGSASERNEKRGGHGLLIGAQRRRLSGNIKGKTVARQDQSVVGGARSS